MQISLSDTGKRFNREWIFRKLSYQFNQGASYAITGPNGSGKSTLLQVIAGAVANSEGLVEYKNENVIIDPEKAFRHISIAAPYQELIEELTLVEFLEFHARFKPFLSIIGIHEIIQHIGLESASKKQIRYYSSGMKQRVKLAQAIFSQTSCVLLDEPCTNLDEDGIALYHRLIEHYCAERLVIVSSNDPQEYGFCKNIVSILHYKK
ncbi:MAG: ATP-binding cassette domain-containing protein [Flavitalea sp.]